MVVGKAIRASRRRISVLLYKNIMLEILLTIPLPFRVYTFWTVFVFILIATVPIVPVAFSRIVNAVTVAVSHVVKIA